MAPGKGREATAFAAEISDYVTENFGVKVLWGGQVGGGTGNVFWYIDYEDLAHLQRGMEWSWTDEGYLELLDRAVYLFDGYGNDTIVHTN
jgi:hypothetical protein